MSPKPCLWSHPTVFEGIHFRSRLEARWYVFFQSLGLEVLYEPNCFVVDGGLVYKPDFKVPSQHRFPISWWFEVKPSFNSDLTKPTLFSTSRCYNIGILTGMPRHGVGFELCKFSIVSGLGGDSDYAFCECRYCGALGFSWEGLEDRIGCDCSNESRHGYFSEQLRDAYVKALSVKLPFSR